MSSTLPGPVETAPFDRRAVRRHRDRAASGFGEAGFLVDEVTGQLTERLEDVNRSFPLALDLGCHDGRLARRVLGLKGIERVIMCDLSPAFAATAAGGARAPGPALAADEERLPFAPATFDLVISCLSLHWVNDLPGALIQARAALKPDGLFLAAMLGGGTLGELRRALIEAEAEVEGRASVRVSPFAELADAAALMQRAGFALPVVDGETITITYAEPLRLMAELRRMGESNAAVMRRRAPARRQTLLRAAELYRERFAGADGRVQATFQVIHLAGWAPDPSQQKPLRPGSATARLADALGAEEVATGERAAPPTSKPDRSGPESQND